MTLIPNRSKIHQIKFSPAAHHSRKGAGSEYPIHPKDNFDCRRDKKRHPNGFTLVELLFVIAIIGVLAAIAIPFFRDYVKKGYNNSAVSDLKNAYTAAQIYFGDYPSGALDENDLNQFGFKSTDKVELEVNDGSEAGLNMTAFHRAGSKTYTIDSAGVITSN